MPTPSRRWCRGQLRPPTAGAAISSYTVTSSGGQTCTNPQRDDHHLHGDRPDQRHELHLHRHRHQRRRDRPGLVCLPRRPRPPCRGHRPSDGYQACQHLGGLVDRSSLQRWARPSPATPSPPARWALATTANAPGTTCTVTGLTNGPPTPSPSPPPTARDQALGGLLHGHAGTAGCPHLGDRHTVQPTAS